MALKFVNFPLKNQSYKLNENDHLFSKVINKRIEIIV